MKNKRAPHRWVIISLAALQIIVGLGAVGGGIFLIGDPTGQRMGFALELLRGSPFNSYLIPGLFLFLVNGLGSLAASAITLRRHPLAGPAALLLGFLLMVWIIIQVLIIGLVHWLQPLFFALGFLELLLGWLL